MIASPLPISNETIVPVRVDSPQVLEEGAVFMPKNRHHMTKEDTTKNIQPLSIEILPTPPQSKFQDGGTNFSSQETLVPPSPSKTRYNDQPSGHVLFDWASKTISVWASVLNIKLVTSLPLISNMLKTSGSSSGDNATNKSSNKNSLFVIGCILWYLAASVNTNISKQILTDWDLPISLTLVQFIGAVTLLYIYCKFLGFGVLCPSSWSLIKLIVPVTLMKVASHYLSSLALSHTPISLVHTIKCLAPLFIVLYYRLFHNYWYSRQTILSLCIIIFGVVLTCFRNASLTFAGFMYAFLGCLAIVALTLLNKRLISTTNKPSSLDSRSAANAKGATITAGSDVQMNTFSILFHTSVMSTVVMMPIWLFSSESGYMYRVMASDQPQEYKSLDDSVTSNSGSSPKHLIFLIVVGCVTNFFQSLLSINLLSVTNAVSYSIASLLKRVFVIGASIVWFQQPVTFLQTSGILIAFVGLYLYEQSKSKRTSPTTVGLDNNYVRSASDLQSQAQ